MPLERLFCFPPSSFLFSLQKLLKDSVQLQERLSLLQAKADLLSDVFGEEKARSLLQELGTDMRKREQLHSQLLQRRARLQVARSDRQLFSFLGAKLQLWLISRMRKEQERSVPPKSRCLTVIVSLHYKILTCIFFSPLLRN